VHEPAFEGAHRWIVPEALHFARHADHCLLDDVLGLLVAEAGPDGGAVDELPIGFEELAPTRLIAQIAQTLDQRAPRGQQFIMLVDGLGMHSHKRTIARPGAFLQKSSHALGSRNDKCSCSPQPI
jgi:hypothetical protein